MKASCQTPESSGPRRFKRSSAAPKAAGSGAAPAALKNPSIPHIGHPEYVGRM
jgi:hypothetical protein